MNITTHPFKPNLMKHSCFTAPLSISLLLLAMATASAQSNTTANNPEQHAQELAQQFIITDGHIDLPFRMKIANFRLQKEWIERDRRYRR